MCNFVTYLKFRADDVCLKYLPALTFCFVLLGRFNDIGIQVYSQFVTMYVTCYSNSHPQYELTWTLGRSLVWICYSSSRLQDNKKKRESMNASSMFLNFICSGFQNIHLYILPSFSYDGRYILIYY